MSANSATPVMNPARRAAICETYRLSGLDQVAFCRQLMEEHGITVSPRTLRSWLAAQRQQQEAAAGNNSPSMVADINAVYDQFVAKLQKDYVLTPRRVPAPFAVPAPMRQPQATTGTGDKDTLTTVVTSPTRAAATPAFDDPFRWLGGAGRR